MTLFIIAQMAWIRAGNLVDLEQHVAGDYPFTNFEYGIKYNHGIGAIHPVVITGWNRGIRVTVAKNYPEGDTLTGMTFGTAVFAKGLDDCNDGDWHHMYFQGGRAGGGSNGVANPELYVRRLQHPWQPIGTLSQLEDQVAGEYPLTNFEYAIKYNHGIGAIHPVVINGWNRGVRVTVVPDYPQGDSLNKMIFGTTVFGKGLDDCNDGLWHHQYYQGGKAANSTNGIVNPDLYARRISPGLEQEEKAQLQAQVYQLQAAAAAQAGQMQALQATHAQILAEFQRQRAFFDAIAACESAL